MRVRPISNEEAIHRIQEGVHAEFTLDDPLVNQVLIEELIRGEISAGVDDDTGKLLFTRPRKD